MSTRHPSRAPESPPTLPSLPVLPPSDFPPPHDPSLAISMYMLPILERGREAFAEYLSKIPVVRRPFGHGQMHIVTREDFVANAGLCIDHVEISGIPTHILCPDGRLCVLVEKLNNR